MGQCNTGTARQVHGRDGGRAVNRDRSCGDGKRGEIFARLPCAGGPCLLPTRMIQPPALLPATRGARWLWLVPALVALGYASGHLLWYRETPLGLGPVLD